MDDASSHPRSNGQAVRFSLQELAWLVAAGTVLILLRLHAFDLPLETDECNYAYIGGRLLAGDRLYVDVWDHQPFGVFALFAGVIAVFGDAPPVFRCVALVFSLVSLGFVYAIARRCAGRGAAFTAAALFALASADPGTAGEGCNREIYMNTLILGAWYAALRFDGSHARPIVASGLLLALASSVKTIVAVHWLFLALWLIATPRRVAGPGQRARHMVVSLLLFGAGPAVLWLGSVAYFAATDRLGEFMDAVFLFNLGYSASVEGFWARFPLFFTPDRHPFIFDSALGLWIGGLAGLIWLTSLAARRCPPFSPSTGRSCGAVVLLAVAGYLTVCLPGRFWPHYYYLLIPALVLNLSVALGMQIRPAEGSKVARARRVRLGLAACLTSAPSNRAATVRERFFADSGPLPYGRGAVYALVKHVLSGAAIVWLAMTVWSNYLSQPAFGITVNRYNSRDFWGRAHGENVRRVTNPRDEVFVYGNEAEIYYYSKRRCASRYTMITGIGAGYPDSDMRRATMMEDLRRRLPRVIVVIFDEDPFDEWKAFLKEHYSEPIGWDFNDRTGKAIMFVLARKDAPIEPIDWNWDRASVGGWMLGKRP